MSSISGLDLNSYYTYGAGGISSNTSASALQETLNGTDLDSATDEELMDVCKSFESYFVEQVLKEAKKMTESSEDENVYMQYFGDTLIQEYADMISEHSNLGIAQNLYDSMKRKGL